jgi:hypothetical protein
MPPGRLALSRAARACYSKPPLKSIKKFHPGPAMIADREALLRRLHELRTEHRDLDTVIARLDAGPVDQLQLQRLKKRKLKLKDEISWLDSQLLPDIIA